VTRVGWLLLLTFVLATTDVARPAGAAPTLPEVWPEGGAVAGIEGQAVRFPSRSPFVIREAAQAAELTEAVGTLFVPETATAASPVPAVVILHGSGGVRATRELTYARQFAAMGVAALVVDAFAARRERWSNFVERLLNVTETMLMADAHAALQFLAARPEIDADRVALLGFSYGAMATTYAAYRTVADRLTENGLGFGAHIAFYGPCVAEFADERTTGAPVLMLMGRLDKIIDVERCAAVAAELERGGSDVETIVYDDAYHQWDDSRGRDWNPPRGLAACRLEVEADGTIRDRATGLPMTGYYTRAAILSFCSDEDGYTIRGDPAVRARSNAAVTRFLNAAWARPPG
jgi:dienelactone hydrolase